MQADNGSQKVQLAPKVFADVSKQLIQSVSEAKTND